jgi:hypothetical protein
VAPAFQEEETPPPAGKGRSEVETFPFQEFPQALTLPQEGTASVVESSLAPDREKSERAVEALEAFVAGQIQAGQVLFRMRMGQQLGGAKMKHFYTNLREKVILLVRNSPAHAVEPLQGGGASLDVFYREDGEVDRVSFSPAFGGTLSGLLERAEWKELPSPVKFGLPFKAVRLAITLDSEGRVNVTIGPL